MPDDCEFSVVIPTYNRARLIGRAIDSVLGQTITPAQVIVVDDGSTDDTREICQRYGSRIQYLSQSNAGVSVARNAGIRAARHRWVAFLDSDDLWLPRHLESMRAAIRETCGEAAFYFSDMQMTQQDGGGTLWQLSGFQPSSPFHFTPDATDWMLRRRLPAMLQSSVFSRAALEEHGGFDPRYRVAEDTELFCRLGISGAACAVSGVGCIQTADDSAQNRLTQGAPGSTAPYLEHNVMLWREMLKRFPSLAPRHHSLIRCKCAASFLALAKSKWQARRLGGAMSCFVSTAWMDPRLVVWILCHGNSKGYEQTVRA